MCLFALTTYLWALYTVNTVNKTMALSSIQVKTIFFFFIIIIIIIIIYSICWIFLIYLYSILLLLKRQWIKIYLAITR